MDGGFLDMGRILFCSRRQAGIPIKLSYWDRIVASSAHHVRNVVRLGALFVVWFGLVFLFLYTVCACIE